MPRGRRRTLTHEAVFADQGHGALVLDRRPLSLEQGAFGVAVTGPRRALLAGSCHRHVLASPLRNMMLAGGFGLLQAITGLVPSLAGPLRAALAGAGANASPWDVPPD
jgi:hypothetical protein